MGGRWSPRWEVDVRGRSGRPLEYQVGGRGRPKWEALRGEICTYLLTPEDLRIG